MDLSRPPREPMEVQTQIVVNDIGPFDMSDGLANIKLEISINWRDDRVTDAEKAMEDNLWIPKLNVFNRTREMTVLESKLFARDGICGYDVTVEGPVTVTVGDGLRTFPFDTLEVEIIVDGCDLYFHEDILDLRIVPEMSLHRECFGPQEGGQLAVKFNPQYDPIEDLNEWLLTNMTLTENATKWSRTYKRLFLRMSFSRQPFYYLVKIVFVLLMLDLLSLMAFVLDPRESLEGRLSFIATMFLATTAFLFVISSDLPKTTYLNQLDKLIFFSFGVQV